MLKKKHSGKLPTVKISSRQGFQNSKPIARLRHPLKSCKSRLEMLSRSCSREISILTKSCLRGLTNLNFSQKTSCKTLKIFKILRELIWIIEL